MRQPTQKRARERVRQMLAAARALLEEEGLDSVTTTRVAERAGVPVGSVYQYFDDAGDLLAALHSEITGRITARCFTRLGALPASTSWQRILREVLETYWQGLEEEAALRPLFSHFIRTHPYGPQITQPESQLGRLFDEALVRAGLRLPAARAEAIKITFLSMLSILTDTGLLADDAARRKALRAEALRVAELYLDDALSA
jgi:AcrR family transcriptional regulator